MADGILTSRVIDSAMEQTSRYFDFNEDGFWERVPYFGNDDQILVHSGNVKDFEPQNILGSCFVSCLQEDVSVFSQLRNLAGGKDTIEAHDDICKTVVVAARHLYRYNRTYFGIATFKGKDKIAIEIRCDCRSGSHQRRQCSW